MNVGTIKAISFDGDGTLWDFEKVMRNSLHHVLLELERIDSQAAALLNIDKMIEIRNQITSDLKGVIANLESIRLEAFRRTLKDIGKPNDNLAEHLNQVYLQHRFDDVELYDDVFPVLDTLKARYTLGLLSNGNSYPERTGLPGIFRFVVFSQDFDIEKPDPRIFEIALEKAECTKEQLLHVGDSLTNDVEGAKAAGITCVWLNRNGMANQSNVKPDFEIRSLLELLNIV
jgi:FMN hydrolase / 5-amino-6-(5-phospho-D-ribitylamino)uracil phosphatase